MTTQLNSEKLFEDATRSIRIYNEDYRQAMRHIEDGSVDLILTDIPYNISREESFDSMIKGTNLYFGDWDVGFDESGLAILADKLRPGGSLVTFHSFEQFYILKEVVFKDRLTFKDKLIWHKTNPMPRNRDRRYISDIELATWYVKEGAKWTFHRKKENYESSVLRYPAESGGGFKRYHPTQKNLEMIKKLIRMHSNEGDLVVDPFLGGGTTAVAAYCTGRRFIGVELEVDYFEASVRRVTQEIRRREPLAKGNNN